ncbi:calcineurin-like phosphoesterase C-terminal domain-containing protein [Mucilaginibacter aquatilis]|uniref:Metallophosphoesterase n=1 Tax=Mucilaginibacter aquatilis TaxID=1517760 RepID=A0A6I4IR42_9SPHI|nr:calcineurin-like phosphoesterase family protein [Mucilaginibacter aquatilis]MVN92144.1 metallophosphoesterase [Mucilaginibacter aquatilis]
MNRRLFIQRSLVITGALTLRFRNTFGFNRPAAVTGKVTANGKPLANVLISDGFSIVPTGADGSYQLTPAPKAEFVFISIPSGYEFPHEKFIARHYRRLSEGNNLNFELVPLKQNDNKHTFIVWADPQVRNKKDVAQMMAQSVPDTRKTVKSLAGQLVHGIGVGDLAWDNLEFFNDYDKAIGQIGVPFFQGLGNHDMDYRQGGDETSDRTFKKQYGPTYYSFNRGRAHYVMIDDVRYLGREREYDGYITEEQLEWLEKDLQYVKKDALLIICLHIPVYNQVKNNKALYRLLRPFKNVHIMSGHTHYNENNVDGNIYEHNHGTVCGAWWTGPVCEDGCPRGYAVYSVEGNDMKWYYKSMDTDKSNQLSLYIDEEGKAFANVYNWDPKWKVEYWIDGQYKGVMKNEPGLDPIATKLYLGDKLPAGRTFPEPRETKHLFVAKMKEGKKIKVVATDRFGDKYEREMEA